MRPPASRWRHLRSAHPGAEVWPGRHAVGLWPHQCVGPAATCGGRRDVAAAVTAPLSGRADRELPGGYPTSDPLSDSTPPFPPPPGLFAVQLPRAAFPHPHPQSPVPSPSSGHLAADVLSAPARLAEVCFSSLLLAPPGRAPSASVASAMAQLSRGALAVLGLQQGSPHEVAAENRLFLCELQESSGDLRRGPQSGVRGAGRWGAWKSDFCQDS